MVCTLWNLFSCYWTCPRRKITNQPCMGFRYAYYKCTKNTHTRNIIHDHYSMAYNFQGMGIYTTEQPLCRLYVLVISWRSLDQSVVSHANPSWRYNRMPGFQLGFLFRAPGFFPLEKNDAQQDTEVFFPMGLPPTTMPHWKHGSVWPASTVTVPWKFFHSSKV